MIRVLIVEDLLVVRQFLEHVLSSDPEIHVVGAARDGEEALELVRLTKPDVITMDINMPGMNGFETTRRIMEVLPAPIVIVSASWDPREVEKGFRAIEAGAVALLTKPSGGDRPESAAEIRELLRTVKLMSEVKVVRRWPRAGQAGQAPIRPPDAEVEADPARREIEIVAIGASTGGPIPIQTILRGLPPRTAASVLIVQHIAAGFVPGFAEWLVATTGRAVQVGRDGESIEAGRAYVAPEGFHMGVADGRRIELSGAAPENGVRPSASYLFRSVARVFGPKAAGVLLSGMGIDGAEALKLMSDTGATTFAQDEESCVVYGMPGEAARLNAAVHSLPPEGIAAVLAGLLGAAGASEAGRT